MPDLIQHYHLPAFRMGGSDRMEEGLPRSLYLYGTLTAGGSTGIVPVVKDRMAEGYPWSLLLYGTLTAGRSIWIVLVA